jgi:hypothetical protein
MTGYACIYLAWKFCEITAILFETPLHVSFLVILQVFDQRDELETGGLYFPMSVACLCELLGLRLKASIDETQTVVGLYVEQACMACLFFLKISITRVSSIVEAVLMVVLLVITASAHIIIRGSFHRKIYASIFFFAHSPAAITKYLPMSLAMKERNKRCEQERLHQERLDEKSEKHSNATRMHLGILPVCSFLTSTQVSRGFNNKL